MSRKPAFDRRRSRASARLLPRLSGRRASARCGASPCSAPAWPILKTISAILGTWRSAASPRRTTPRCRFARSSTMAGIPSMWPASRTTPPRRQRRRRASCRRIPPPACCSRRASRAAAAISMWCSRRAAAPACCRCRPRHPTPTSCCCACRRCARRSSTHRPPDSPMRCSPYRSSWRSRSTAGRREQPDRYEFETGQRIFIVDTTGAASSRHRRLRAVHHLRSKRARRRAGRR